MDKAVNIKLHESLNSWIFRFCAAPKGLKFVPLYTSTKCPSWKGLGHEKKLRTPPPSKHLVLVLIFSRCSLGCKIVLLGRFFCRESVQKEDWFWILNPLPRGKNSWWCHLATFQIVVFTLMDDVWHKALDSKYSIM